MLETVDTRSRVDRIRNRAIARCHAGFGNIYSETNIRRRDPRELMRDTTTTHFRDTITIFGKPACPIPIGTATFRYRVPGMFRQPFSAASIDGRADLAASFTAIALTPGHDTRDRRFPTLTGPQLIAIRERLFVTVMFVIGVPFLIAATLDGKSRERKATTAADPLGASLNATGLLQPVIVTCVDDPHIFSLSGTKYYVSSEANAQDVKLLAVDVDLVRD